MGVIAVDVDARVRDVTHREKVELLLPTVTSRVDWEQDRPRDASAQETYNDHHLEEAHKEVAVDRLVVQDILILEIFEVFYPSEHAPARGWSLSLNPQMVEVCPRCIHSAERLAENDEGRDKGGSEDSCRDQCRQERRQAVRRISGLASLTALLRWN